MFTKYPDKLRLTASTLFLKVHTEQSQWSSTGFCCLFGLLILFNFESMLRDLITSQKRIFLNQPFFTLKLIQHFSFFRQSRLWYFLYESVFSVRYNRYFSVHSETFERLSRYICHCMFAIKGGKNEWNIEISRYLSFLSLLKNEKMERRSRINLWILAKCFQLVQQMNPLVSKWLWVDKMFYGI